MGGQQRERKGEREGQKQAGVEKVWKRSDREEGGDRASFSDTHRAVPTSTPPHTATLGC